LGSGIDITMTVYVVNGAAPSYLPTGTRLLPNIISNVVNVTFATTGNPTTSAAAATATTAAPVQTPAPATSAPRSSTQAPTAAAAKTVPASIVMNAVSLGNKAYSPDPISINVGDTIVWSNQDSVAHTVTSATAGGSFTSSGPLSSGALTQGQTFSQRFTTTGTFTYGCQIHGV
jgi:plastocyanin